mmetsp:Transcript_119089/g.167449  ORF Transcript_119089/g.167449 Transcript_119089/m.167449 type:complete len:264 (+) Transcript_119089:75-866(+)
MLRSLWPAVLVLGAVEAAVIGHGEEGRIEAVASEAEAVAMPLVEVFRETSPSALLQKLQADPKLDKDLPVVHVGPTSDQDIDNMVKKERDAAWMSVGIIAASICVYIGLIVLLGWCYTKLWSTPVMPEFKAPADVEVEDFRYGVFSCLEDMHICALSCCCMPYRWADTLQAAGIMSFWSGVLLFFVIYHIRWWAQDYGLILGLLAWLCATLVFTYYRQQLREIFSIKNDTMDKVKDFSLWCCCCFCAAAQEARQVQQTKMQDV